MNTEIICHPSMISGKNNNNPSKKWNASTLSGLVSVDESIESIVTEQNAENMERSIGGRERSSRNNSLEDIKEDKDCEDDSEIRITRPRHNSIVGIVKNFGREKRNSANLEDKRGRRKSWHSKFTHLPKEKLSKSERKRRQGTIESAGKESEEEGSLPSTPVPYDRHKRKSWWNIFVPEDFSSNEIPVSGLRNGMPSSYVTAVGDTSRRKSNPIPIRDGSKTERRGAPGEGSPQGESLIPEIILGTTYAPRPGENGFSFGQDVILLLDDFLSDGADIPSSRRASTDVGRSVFPVPYTRSKSRSVDHGISSPFDLDLLRSKVDDRFESVADSDGDLEKEKKKVSPPINTIPYKVQPSDTLNSVAARFDITPSELRKLNRLASNLIFPGQTIHVPQKKPTADDEERSGGTGSSISTSEEGESEPPPEEKEILDNLRPVSPKPGHIERVKSPMSPLSRKHDPREARFLKINVRHITDGQGVVGGVLLVTPNAVMFDPNVSDPLVIEHGPESYGVIAPMEFVVNAAIYYDIAHMRVGHVDNKSDCIKPQIYYNKTSEKEPQGSPGRDSLLVKDETFPELAPSKGSSDEDNESISSYAGREGDAFPKAFERDLVTPTNLDATSNNNPDATVPTLVSQQSFPEMGANSGTQNKLEERRASSLDQHWAVPKQKNSTDSNDSTVESDKIQLGESARGVDDGMGSTTPSEERGDRSRLTKLSCHDSGIDIRETTASSNQEALPPTKKVVHDADVVLSPKNECVLLVSNQEVKKKCGSVSFNVEEEDEEERKSVKDEKDDEKAAEGKKSKMLKRLSYPLSWMEGTFVNESKDSEKDSLPSLPTSADSQHSSVFSKVFSSSPKTLVSDIGSGLSDIGSGIGSLGSGIVDIGSGIGSGIVDIGSGIGSGIVDIGSGIVDIGSGIGSGLSDFSSNLFLTKNPSEESGGSKSPGGPNTPVTRSPLATRFPPNAPSPSPGTPLPDASAGAKKEGIFGRSSVGTFIRNTSSSDQDGRGSLSRHITPKLDYRSMVSVEDMPELFVSFDKLIPRPARSCEDPPLYLRLRMGRPIDRKIPKSTPIMSYGKKKMRPEYWFSVPRNRVDDLYNFLHIWVPHLYGDLDEIDPKARGYELVESDTELWDEEETPTGEGVGDAGEGDDMPDFTRESWEMVKAPYVKLYTILKSQNLSSDSQGAGEEVLSISEELRRALYASSVGSLDMDPFVPDLVGTTEILTEEHRKQLCRHLPARAEGYMWTLVFSTSQHGFSLNSLYRKMGRVESPILLVIQDTDNNVFGALTSCSLKVSDHFYGTGESLLFRFNPEFSAYQWTGDNMYFIKGNNESLAIGAGDGKFGLWLDGDLYQGRSERCTTYDNPPLSSNEDFVVKTLECWAFI